MPNEFMFIQQLLGSGIQWTQVALLSGILVVLIARPERIHTLWLFQLACWLLGLSFVLPAILHCMVGMIGGSATPSPYNPRGIGEFTALAAVAIFLGPMLFGASVLAALLALMPRAHRLEPPRHPLE